MTDPETPPPAVTRARTSDATVEWSGWFAGLALSAVPVAAALWLREDGHGAPAVWGALQVLSLATVGALLLAARDPGARRCALAAGVGAGVLVGTALAQRAPTAWFMRDVAWHTAKVALTAAGHPIEDPILRVPTIYPPAFSALVGAPVALGVPLRAAMWSATAVSLAGTLAAFWFLARSFLTPRAAAWAALALPFVFYAPLNGYWLLPNPFNASLPFVFCGLGLLARGASGRPDVRTVAAGALLGLAGLLWYGHLLWVVPLALSLVLSRRAAFARVAAGAAPFALLFVVHLTVVARAGHLASAGVRAAEAAPVGERLLALARNLLTLTGGTALHEGPWWVGTLLLAAVVVALARRPPVSSPSPGARVRALVPLAVLLLACALYAGLRMTYWDPFAWRYTFLAYALLVVAVGAARPWTVAGRALGPVVALGLAGVVSAPYLLRNVVAYSRVVAGQYEREVLPLARALDERTGPDEPVLASTETWERALACAAPRPTLVDRNGGTYKYAPASVAGPRWEAAQRLAATAGRDALLELLAPYGFRYAVVSRRDRSQPGYETLATGFEVVHAGGPYVLVDLTRPR